MEDEAGQGRSHRQSHRPTREVTAPVLSAPEPLGEHHQLADFDSGEPSLDDWLKRRAAKNQANGSSRTYVVCEGPVQDRVIGYYCLAAGAIGHAEAPSTMKRNRPDPVPVLVLGRLAIHKDHHLKGIGTALLNDAIRRAIQAADIAGVTALLVHAISEQARRFYLSRGFIESPVRPMTLCLMLATVEQALREP
jgi:GNAT superfamily N-acetyltransferase